jgi:hypothetical protein
MSQTDEMRRPVSDGMLYPPKVSTCLKAQIKKESGNEAGSHRGKQAEPGFHS